MNIFDDKKTMKKLVSSFVGVVGASTFISFPVLAQTNLNSSPPTSAAPRASTTKPNQSSAKRFD